MSEKVVGTTAANSPGSKSRRVVLVVDDEQALRDLVCRTLRAEGYLTLEAAHGGEALEMVESGPEAIDLVVTDVVMPGMDGGELGRRLARSRPTLPVLYMSAYEVNDIFQRGSPRLSAPFLQKPFPRDGLINSVEQLLRTGSSR